MPNLETALGDAIARTTSATTLATLTISQEVASDSSIGAETKAVSYTSSTSLKQTSSPPATSTPFAYSYKSLDADTPLSSSSLTLQSQRTSSSAETTPYTWTFQSLDPDVSFLSSSSSSSSSSSYFSNLLGAQTNAPANAGAGLPTTIYPYVVSTQDGVECIVTFLGSSTTSYGSVNYGAQTVDYGAQTAHANVVLAPRVPFQRRDTVPYTAAAVPQTGSSIAVTSTALSDLPLCTLSSATTSASDSHSSFSASGGSEEDDGDSSSGSTVSGKGLSTGQRGGLAAGLVLGVAILVILGAWWARRRGSSRRTTNAQRNMWGWSGEGGNAREGGNLWNTVGARNAEVQEVRALNIGTGTGARRVR